ncbi:Replication factor C subunit 2 [Ogataea parapolymorpha DL-1]|uniref:Replication factor C subunit 2 n=1 Tax=Ogataea parapolymorpha (strain ATCC 26012 / BCRC 20466 / JCM 22074 / NRRL Y-7560 / DL-1) TaxID=871575 RepID=W1QE62_OGAPD|nr:Replication factor C subunit 2 [Ogataea parapolymorpha DL-1]ESW99729.1 Replication factor C subunit 2 [Ogataea parapolymorpha DL-1]
MSDQKERMPWVEKYRPKTLDEITSQSHAVQVLKRNLQTANLPHMLFYGPPGTGKTSTILAMAKELYGPHLFRSRVLELNASDERGISIVRDKIKNFARLSISNPSKEDLEKYPCPPYKLLILDEADSMTSDAQSALRRTMETYSGITRFCLICNYITRIIDPLASRCSKFRFKMLDEENSIKRLQYICNEENVTASTPVLKEILRISDGDLRKAINFLQSVHKMLMPAEDEMADDVTEDQIRDVFGYLPKDQLMELIRLAEKKDMDRIFEFVTDYISKEGYNATLIISSLHDVLLLGDDSGISLSLDGKQKNSISRILFETDARLSHGCDETIQILDCVLRISTVL